MGSFIDKGTKTSGKSLSIGVTAQQRRFGTVDGRYRQVAYSYAAPASIRCVSVRDDDAASGRICVTVSSIVDSDGDGILDAVECSAQDGCPMRTATEFPISDPDDDNDGISTTGEGNRPDGDGILDHLTPTT
jgi:hypothetical protein